MQKYFSRMSALLNSFLGQKLTILSLNHVAILQMEF